MKRKILTALAALGIAPAVFAAEGDNAQLAGVITDVQSGLSTMAGQVLTAVGAIVVACLAFWGLRALVAWAKRYFGK